MHSADGKNYWGIRFYCEIITFEKIVNADNFADEDGKTLLKMQMLFETAEERGRTVKVFNAVEGLDQTLEKLNKYVLILK
ncbi:MAG: hypothetical protein P4L45_10830 [Ignavibacteriaceae bacterium]|nr:hypothetical protein [Ignavibacteriaceae bacterium]